MNPLQATLRQTPVPPHLHDDPYAVETLLNSHAFHRRLRDTAAVVWLPQHEVYAVKEKRW